MASKHEIIKWKVITDWSVQRKGRLYCMNQGLATPIYGDTPLWFGPLKRKFKGFSDLFGFSFYSESDNHEVIFPVFTVIEVKTKNDTLSKEQKLFLTYIKSIGGFAYVAWESENEKGYTLEEWKCQKA